MFNQHTPLFRRKDKEKNSMEGKQRGLLVLITCFLSEVSKFVGYSNRAIVNNLGDTEIHSSSKVKYNSRRYKM